MKSLSRRKREIRSEKRLLDDTRRRVLNDLWYSVDPCGRCYSLNDRRASLIPLPDRDELVNEALTLDFVRDRREYKSRR
jgi:hypothetical protein